MPSASIRCRLIVKGVAAPAVAFAPGRQLENVQRSSDAPSVLRRDTRRPAEPDPCPRSFISEFHGIGSPHGGVTDKNEPMYWLSRETFVSLLQAIVVTREGDLPVAITFDDGNESDALIALPELAKRNLKAIFFVVGGRIGMPHYLDRAALRDLVSSRDGDRVKRYAPLRLAQARLDDASCRSSRRPPPHRNL